MNFILKYLLLISYRITFISFKKETRRRQQTEAAERRRAQEAARGVKDPERVRRMQERAEEMDRREQELRKEGGANLKVHTRDKVFLNIDFFFTFTVIHIKQDVVLRHSIPHVLPNFLDIAC